MIYNLRTFTSAVWAAAFMLQPIQPVFAKEQETSDQTVSTEIKAVEGEMLFAKGKRIGPVYRVGEDGSAQIILERKMYVVPVSTLSIENGRLTTSLSKGEIIRGAN